jgi:hypothetical protein
VAESNSNERDKRLLRWRKHFSPVLQLHDIEGDKRQRSEHVVGDEEWRNRLSLAAAIGACMIRCGRRRGWPMMVIIPRAKQPQGLED